MRVQHSAPFLSTRGGWFGLRHRADRQRRPATRRTVVKECTKLAQVVATAAVAMIAVDGARAFGQPFNPVRKNLEWSTNRSLVDIEVVGSSSLVPDMHRLEPERVLRFRLERAYVQSFLVRKEPGFEIASFGFDMETGLPDSLIIAVSQPGRFHEDIPGVPVLSQSDRVKRTLLVSLYSDLSMRGLRNASDYVSRCHGAAVDDGLWAYEWKGRPGCYPLSFPKGSEYAARYSHEMLLHIRCQEDEFPGIGCAVNAPFDAFGIKVVFHREHLPRWRGMIERASAFLRSKQYR